MGLITKLLQLSLRVLLRLGIIVVALFALHLVLTRLWPQVQRTQELLDEQPLVEQRLRQAKAKLEVSREQTKKLEQELEVRSKAELSTLKREVDALKQQTQVLEARKLQALKEIEQAGSLVDEYCDTYNPFKLWFCKDMKERAEALEKQLDQVVSSVEDEAKRARDRLSSLQGELDEVARDPEARMRVLSRRAPEETKRMLAAIERAREAEGRAKNEVLRWQKREHVARQVRESTLGWLVQEWQRAWPRLLTLALIVLLLPFVQRTLWYFALMPLVSRARAIELASERAGATLTASEAQRSLRVELHPGEELYARPSYARPVEGAASSKLLYRYSAPFISYAAGLFMLTKLRGKEGATTSATLSAPEDPNSYLMRVELKEHPGVVIHPRYLVGVIGNLELHTRWKPFSWHAWSTWQLRYILLSGTGSLIIEGIGDVVAERLDDSRAKIEQKLVLGFDTRLSYRTSRTETFLPYLFGSTRLVDDTFERSGTYFWQKSIQRPHKNPLERGFDALFSALGKLLGF